MLSKVSPSSYIAYTYARLNFDSCTSCQAILGRKFVSSEVFELMQNVSQLSVTSDSEHVRQQCRQVSTAVYDIMNLGHVT